MGLRAQLRPAFLLLVNLTILTGMVYPLAVTGVAQLVFPVPANGSLIIDGGNAVGSSLIGQPFDDPRYFWGRLSATTPSPYNATSSSGSNQGPLSDALLDAVKGRLDALHAADPTNRAPVPVDLVTASGSGLDPDITPAAALYQAARVARVRGIPLAQVRTLVDRHTQGRTFGILGEPRVNVLALNRALDGRARR